MTRNQTAISDEEIIAALLKSGTIAQAAELTGLSARAIYDRMGNRDFKAAYSAAKTDIIRAATLDMNRNLSAAVAVIMDVMNDQSNPAMTRLQAARMLIDSAARFADRMAKEDAATATWAESAFGLNPKKW